jgi:NADH dehydrogenase FAD-containing subunit
MERSIGKRWSFMQHLRDAKVTMLRNVDLKEITLQGVKIVDGEGKERTVAADTVIIAGGMGPNRALSEALKGKAPQIIDVGDCSKLRLIHGSVEDGYRAGLAV